MRRRRERREARIDNTISTQAQPLLDKCVEDTKSEAGCLYYGWTVKEDGSKLFCRETYVDGAAAGNHLSCVAASGALGEALEKGYIELDNIDVMGTEADIAAAQKVPEYAAFGLGAWTVWDSFQNFKQTSAEEASTADFYTIQPTFTIKDLAKAERGFLDSHHIIAVNAFRWNTKRLSAGAKVAAARDSRGLRGGGIAIVFAHKQNRQFECGRPVQAFKERSAVHSTIAKDADGNLIAAAQLDRMCSTSSDIDIRADNAVCT